MLVLQSVVTVQTNFIPGLGEEVYDTVTGITYKGNGYTPVSALTGIAGGGASAVQVVEYEIFPYATALATGDGKGAFPVPALLNGMNLTGGDINVFAKSTSGLITVQVARGRRPDATTTYAFVDMLSTPFTIDVNEFDSLNATTVKVINVANDDVTTGDLIRLDVDIAGTGATGLWARLYFATP